MKLNKINRIALAQTKKALIGFTLVLALAACEDFFVSEATNVTPPGSEPQLVVYSFISPSDTVIRVFVDRSTPHINPQLYKPVNENAIVKMAKKQEEFTTLTYDSESGFFSISAKSLSIEPGNFYKLKVETPEGEKLEAECFVPVYETISVSIEPIRVSIDEWGLKNGRVNWVIEPTPGNQERYYRTICYSAAWLFPDNNNPDTIQGSNRPLYIDRGQALFQSSLAQAFSFRAEYYNPGSYFWYDYDNWQYIESTNGTDSVFVSVMQTDEHYYKFHKSLDNYYYYGDDFPFAEPTRIYTNVKGGLGVFAAYSRKNYYVPFEETR